MILLGIAFVVLIYLILALPKSSFLAVTKGRTSWWTVLFYREIFVLILPGVFLVEWFGPESLLGFQLVDVRSAEVVSIAAILALILFMTSSFFLEKLFPIPGSRFAFNYLTSSATDRRQIDLFCILFMSCGLLLLTSAILFLDYKHSFFDGLVNDVSILESRLANSYHSRLPAQLMHLLGLSFYITSIYSGMKWVVGNKLASAIIYSIGLFIGTSSGAKSPVVEQFAIFVITLLIFGKKVNVQTQAIRLALCVVFVGLAIFKTFSLQYPDADSIQVINDIFVRFGTGQMLGLYETISLDFYSQEYQWHCVPFAKMFVNYPIYPKDLMVYTEGGDFYSSGVKNSLFIAEAYAMGGWALVIVSPIFMAIGVHIRMLMLYTTLRYSFSSPVAKIFSTPLLLLTSSLTGDFSSFALQKGTILLFMIFIPFLIAKNIFGLFSKSTPPT